MLVEGMTRFREHVETRGPEGKWWKIEEGASDKQNKLKSRTLRNIAQKCNKINKKSEEGRISNQNKRKFRLLL